MMRECHVRFYESAEVQILRATHRNVYVRSRRAGERAIASISRFLTKKLRLKVDLERRERIDKRVGEIGGAGPPSSAW